jgi:hypothetical protein
MDSIEYFKKEIVLRLLGVPAVILFLILPLFMSRPNLQWLIFPFATFIGLAIELKRFRSGIKLAVLMGVFLSVFDWVIENLGALYGYWVSNFSNFYVLAVPFEVSVAAVFGGALLSLIGTNYKLKVKQIVIGSALFALGMTFGEYYANMFGLMKYGNGWWSLHAFFAYFGTWLLFFFLNRKLSRIKWLSK